MFWKRRKIVAEIREVECLMLHTDDIIVLSSSQPVSKEVRDYTESSLKEKLAIYGIHNEIITLTHGIRLLLLRKKI
jgi:hypothetical protein